MRIIPQLTAADARRLAPLLALYAGAMMKREPAAPDIAYAGRLLAEPVVSIAAAEIDGRLAGFALFYDLPEAISGLRAGQLDDLFVEPASRGNGLAEAMIATIVEHGAARGWAHLRWMVPDGSPAAGLYDRIAERAPWRNYVIRIDRSVNW